MALVVSKNTVSCPDGLPRCYTLIYRLSLGSTWKQLSHIYWLYKDGRHESSSKAKTSGWPNWSWLQNHGPNKKLGVHTVYSIKKGVKHHDWLIAEFCLWFSGMVTRTGTPSSSQNLAPDDVTEQDGSAFICNIITKLCPVTHFLLEWLHATPSGKRWYYWSGWVTCFKMLTFARVGHIFCFFLSLGKYCFVFFIYISNKH